jgi:hypothetical protein
MTIAIPMWLLYTVASIGVVLAVLFLIEIWRI